MGALRLYDTMATTFSMRLDQVFVDSLGED
jgi:hypothetical protein